jgi:outer membrane protein OmpA-like peptidoglycan-associated protein
VFLNKYFHTIFVVLAPLAAVIVNSCAIPPDLSHKDCTPPPSPECNPGVSNAVGIDTAHMQPGNFKYHIDLLPKPVNSDNNDNAIAFFPNQKGQEAIVSTERKDGDDRVQRMYSSTLLPDLHFDDIKGIAGAESFFDIGAADYCAADGKLYFTAKAHNDDPNDYDLYCGKLVQKGDGFVIEDTVPLTELNKAVSFEAQPAVSKDGLMIVFASDRNGGHEGVDLWYSTRNSVNSPWNEPKDLPSSINTPCNELSPSFSADGKKLFFSSDGHETIGGYDIFSSSYEDGSWSKAENIGAPINTKSDEIFPYQLSDSQFFYTSDQPASFRGRNIFVLRRTYIPPKEIAEKNIPDSIELKGKVEMPPVQDTVLPEVFVRDVAKNKEIARKKTDTVGKYSFTVEKGREYDVGSDRKDKFYDVHRVDLRHPTDSVIVVPPLVIPDTLVLRINFPFDDDSHPYDFIIDENGQKSAMLWQTSIDLIAKSIKNSSASLQSVTLYGYTDSLGTDEYNNALAGRRAEFVAKQLKARGIPAKILVIVSKGRAMPVKRQPGESDETFQLRCRRVELIKFFTKENKR